MYRSALLALVVASGAMVLATSVAAPHRPVAPDPPAAHAESAASAPGAGRTGPLEAAGSAGRVDGRPGVRARWRWPLWPRPVVLRLVRAPESTYGAGHRGLDLAAADGTPVLAVEGGVVTHAAPVAGRGTVTVAHPGGLSSTYEPLDPVVGVGAVVDTGDVLGTLRVRDGPTHCGVRACLHLGARRGGSYLDPYPLLAGGRLALLPLG